jgi:AraC-like DNA-binding protein
LKIPMLAGSQVALNPEASPFQSVSTEGIKVSERRDFWEASARYLFGAVHLEMQRRDAFRANFKYTSVADLVLCRLASSVPHRVACSDTTARQLGRDFVKAVLQIDGCSVLSQNGRTTPLRAGEWTVYDFEQPYSVEIPKRTELCILLIPREKVLTGEFDFGSFALRRFSGRRGLGKLIWSLALATFDQIPEIQDRSSRDVADILVQMIRMALVDSSQGRTSVDSKEALRERVKLYIARHLGDPDLSITKLASVTQCSKRYLHMVFQPEEISISDYILKLRLDRCREDLLNPAYAHRSITEIAYSWGFNNSNHFSRCFKQAFGVCPRHMRSAFTAWPSDRSENPLTMPRPQLPATLLLPALGRGK